MYRSLHVIIIIIDIIEYKKTQEKSYRSVTLILAKSHTFMYVSLICFPNRYTFANNKLVLPASAVQWFFCMLVYIYILMFARVDYPL